MSNNFNNKEHNNIVTKERNHEFDLFDPFGDFFKFPNFTKENSMKTDVRELENSFVLDIDLPSYNKQDINIDFNNGYLTISATRKEEKTEEDKKFKYLRKERFFGSVSRSFYVGDIEQDEIDAKLENGTLTVCIPKERKNNSAKRIEIK